MAKRVMLLTESNYVLDVCLTRHHDCLYLFRLALDGEIELVAPDYALAEVEAKFKALELEMCTVFSPYPTAKKLWDNQ